MLARCGGLQRSHRWAIGLGAAVGRGKRLLSASINARSARREISSRGEKPRFHLRDNVSASAAAVRRRLGQAFNAHCPLQVSCHALESGNR
mgnify:CR=1 FL=1